ncbi:hypothetical protein TGDOM2_244690 [Toxoplasma gondii GAB2-2007-GAL-DOM2]|uniref:Uncharacterized protein n=4 Tax=Toxoplasma gondii TaxID=5811 RepID=S7VMU7_TOXGG|nr:hypothetical protein TGGT1_244690 [Toxoplasma gondii GT1]KAF4643110.1 hypothetical protein TGRH88_027770 [Toxoplasma gondii]KFG36496.1 hypothetical protein TGDOM2_244690 [Toxoplasma gondii GAB2-2007-GAL-DOM2]KFG51655.1 hypothetical protein TGFOU_244690 [Toxoplasma gondii FOU]
MEDSGVSAAASSCVARSRANPFFLPSSYSWWGEAEASTETSSGNSPAERDAFASGTAAEATSSCGAASCAGVDESEEGRRLTWLKSQFAAASFWAIDDGEAATPGRSLPSHEMREAPPHAAAKGGASHPASAESVDAAACEASAGSSDLGDGSRAAEVLAASSGDIDAAACPDTRQDEILCPVFRLMLKHRCNLTLVGRRLCDSDLLLRTLAVVHGPADGAARESSAGTDCPAGKKRKTDLQERLHRDEDWRQVLALDGEGEAGTADGAGSSRGDSLYLRHITLHVSPCSALARSAAAASAPREASSLPSSGEPESSRALQTVREEPESLPRTPSSRSDTGGAIGPAFSYGLLLVRLQALPEKVRAAVVEAGKPFGRLLEDHKVVREVMVEKKLHVHLRQSFFANAPPALARERPAGSDGDSETRDSRDTPAPQPLPECTCLPVTAAHGPSKDALTCTFGRWSVVLCNGKRAARVLEIVNSSLLLRAAALAREKSGERTAAGRPTEREPGSPTAASLPAPLGESLQAVKQTGAERQAQALSEEAEAALKHLSQVCLCSAQDCPVHKHLVDIPSVWGPPGGFATTRGAGTEKKAGAPARQPESSEAERCFNCGSALCVEMFQRE